MSGSIHVGNTKCRVPAFAYSTHLYLCAAGLQALQYVAGDAGDAAVSDTQRVDHQVSDAEQRFTETTQQSHVTHSPATAESVQLLG